MTEGPMDVQNCLDVFYSYCNERKLHINVSKTKDLIFGACSCHDRQFRIGNEKVETVGNYKYLGIYFSQTGSFLNAKKHFVQQQRKQRYSCSQELHVII